MHYLFYILGLAPSFIWLAFYLRKDKHPESNWMVATTFFLGMVSALVILVLELGAQGIINYFGAKINLVAKTYSASLTSAWLLTNSDWLMLLISVFFAGAVIEEYVKYRATRFWVAKNSELDEPIDIMLYMIIGALGFAAMENIMVLHNQNFHEALTAQNAFITIGWRFVSATLLHALCSGIVGFFWAYSIYKAKRQRRLIAMGLAVAIILHGLYNWVIMKGNQAEKIIIPLFLLLVMSAFVSYGFTKLKKLKSICLIKN